MDHPKPLWIITFDPKIPEKPFQERAVFSSFSNQPVVIKTPPPPTEADKQALEFLSKVNTSLKNITEAYLSIAEKHEELKPKANEIRERLNVLNQWLGWIRSWLEPPKKDDVD